MKPALTLLLLGPWVAEYLLGSHTVVDLPLIVFLVPMYGGGALLIREVTRRAGRGWPTLILLGLAYGLIEAGLLDQSLFNPSYMEEDFNSLTHIPWLGASATYVIAFVGGHAIWSIGTPIALVEAWWPSRADRPWLGRFGLGVASVLYLSGSALIRVDHRETEQFTAATHQQVIAGLSATVLIAAAFLVGRRRPAVVSADATGDVRDGADATDARPAPRPRRVALAAFLATGAFVCVSGTWVGVALALALAVGAAAVVLCWSRRHGWGPAHQVAVACGALMTQAWVGFVVHPWYDVSPELELTSDVLFVFVAAAMGLLAVRHATAIPTGRQVAAEPPPTVTSEPSTPTARR